MRELRIREGFTTEQRKLVAIMFTDVVGCELSPTRLPNLEKGPECCPGQGLLTLALAGVALAC